MLVWFKLPFGLLLFCLHLLNLYIKIFTFPYFFCSFLIDHSISSYLSINSTYLFLFNYNQVYLWVKDLSTCILKSQLLFQYYESLCFLLLINYNSTSVIINEWGYLIVSSKTLYPCSLLTFTYYSLFFTNRFTVLIFFPPSQF